ncbi:WavE lipopolysaccharide synthesis family protein [Vibrio sp. 2-Bac 85]
MSKGNTFNDITVVVQGPVQALSDRNQEEGITYKCLKSIRQHLPGAKIILSTWRDQILDGLDYDQLVLCDDPGSNIRQYKLDGTPKYYNNNRQIVSSYEGLKKVETKYAMKLRSDNYLTSNNFVELQKTFQKRCETYRFLQERVVMSNVFARQYSKGHRVAFHLNDFFYFGLRQDLLTLWDLPLVKDYIPSDNKPYHDSHPNYAIDCAQLFWLMALNKFDANIKLKHLLDNSKDKLIQSNICYANNVVIASPEEIGLGLCTRFLQKSRVSKPKGKCSHIYFYEWQALYKKYCDPKFKVECSLKDKVELNLYRLRYIFPLFIEAKLRILKKHTQWYFDSKEM